MENKQYNSSEGGIKAGIYVTSVSVFLKYVLNNKEHKKLLTFKIFSQRTRHYQVL